MQVKEITKLNPKLKALQEKGKTKKGSEGDYAKDERETRVNKILKLNTLSIIFLFVVTVNNIKMYFFEAILFYMIVKKFDFKL